jgi:chaperonin GroES
MTDPRDWCRAVLSGIIADQELDCTLRPRHDGPHRHESVHAEAEWTVDRAGTHVAHMRFGPGVQLSPEVREFKRYAHRAPNPYGRHKIRAGTLHPLDDRIVVRPDPKVKRWTSGLWIPNTAKDDNRPQTGTVLGVGPKRRDVAEGDRVLYRQWGGTEVTVGGTFLLVLPARDVFALLEEET